MFIRKHKKKQEHQPTAGKVIIHNYKNKFIIDFEVIIRANKKYITSIGSGKTISIPITEPTILQCGRLFIEYVIHNSFKSIKDIEIAVSPNYITEIWLEYELGALRLSKFKRTPINTK